MVGCAASHVECGENSVYISSMKGKADVKNIYGDYGLVRVLNSLLVSHVKCILNLLTQLYESRNLNG